MHISKESMVIGDILSHLGQRSIVLVGLMGSGKTSIGRRLASKLEIPFVDTDEEIERVAAKSVIEIFADHGEEYFRDGERRVIARLLKNGPQVLATGGGAFINSETRANIRDNGLSIWLRAELPILMRRVTKKDSRPLLKKDNPEEVMRSLMNQRYPIYQQADITIESKDVSHEIIVNEALRALRSKLLQKDF